MEDIGQRKRVPNKIILALQYLVIYGEHIHQLLLALLDHGRVGFRTAKHFLENSLTHQRLGGCVIVRLLNRNELLSQGALLEVGGVDLSGLGGLVLQGEVTAEEGEKGDKDDIVNVNG